MKSVDIRNPYVYMDYLQTTNSDVWDRASNLVHQFNSSLNSFTSSERMQNAIIFLRTLAEKQRTGEIEFVNNKINELKKKKTISTKEIERLEKRQENLIESIKAGESFDYKEFTSLLNEVATSKEALAGRIKTLENNISAKRGEGKQINGLLEDIGQEIINIISILNKEKEKINKTEKSYVNIMPIILTDFMEKNKKQLSDLSPKELIGWITKTTIKFRQFLEKDQGLSGFTSIPDFTRRKEILEQEFEQFLKMDNVFNINEKDRKLLNEISDQFSKTNLNKIDLNRKHFEISNPYSGIPATPEIIFNFDLLDYSISEKVSLILNRLGKNFKSTGAANMADDALIGTLTADVKIEYFDELNKKIDETLEKLSVAAKEFAATRNNREQYYENLIKLNEEIENILITLDEELRAKNETGFIIHESDKYYKTIEHGNAGSRQGEFGFHGRNMAIMNYIDAMASISQEFGITQMDPDLWKFVGINLSKHSVAEGCENSTEEIFTLVAGLIMFDDFSTIVKEGMGTLDFSNLYNIHLYKLQSLYFPASYILKETADYLQFCLGENPAKAVVTIPINIYEIHTYSDLKEIYSSKNKKEGAQNELEQKLNKYNSSTADEKWEMVKNYISKETKVSINFFLNFQNFISGIPH